MSAGRVAGFAEVWSVVTEVLVVRDDHYATVHTKEDDQDENDDGEDDGADASLQVGCDECDDDQDDGDDDVDGHPDDERKEQKLPFLGSLVGHACRDEDEDAGDHGDDVEDDACCADLLHG